jgi:hypothetical protein
MSPPDYDANLVPAPSLTREFEAIPSYQQPQIELKFNLSVFIMRAEFFLQPLYSEFGKVSRVKKI